MKYNIGQKFYQVNKEYAGRISREYKTDQDGVRWYREKPQNYKVVISEYEIVAHKNVIITGVANHFDHDFNQYAIQPTASNDDESVSFVEETWFDDNDRIFFDRSDAEEYANILKNKKPL